MNERGRNILIKHAMLGTKQLDGIAQDGHGGYCAQGLFLFAENIPRSQLYSADYGFAMSGLSCPVEGCLRHLTMNEEMLLCHLNNSPANYGHGHGFDFMTIARLLEKMAAAQEAGPGTAAPTAGGS